MRVKVRVKAKQPPKQQTVEIRTDFIRLDSLLKFEGAVETGGHAKQVIQDGEVRLNGEVCTIRGKKLRDGDEILYDNILYKVLVQ